MIPRWAVQKAIHKRSSARLLVSLRRERSSSSTGKATDQFPNFHRIKGSIRALASCSICSAEPLRHPEPELYINACPA